VLCGELDLCGHKTAYVIILTRCDTKAQKHVNEELEVNVEFSFSGKRYV